MNPRIDPFTQYILAKEKELFGENPSPELTHAFRMGATLAMKYACSLLRPHEQFINGPSS